MAESPPTKTVANGIETQQQQHEKRQQGGRVPLGYSKLAGFMVKRDQEMFKLFRKLAVRDILYMQAELCELEYKYDKQALKDANGGGPEANFDREWWQLKNSGERQWQLALQIREKIKEYHAAVIRYSKIDKLTHPEEQHRKLVFNYIHSVSMGGQCEFFGRDLANYPSKSVFHEDNIKDLVFLGNIVEENDTFSRFLLGPAFRGFHWFYQYFKKPVPFSEEDGHQQEDGDTALWHYQETTIKTVVRVIGMAISPILPLAGIIVLFLVEKLQIRLALVCTFTWLFSVCLALVTSARRIEVFAATAAFASVMVVFVGQIEDPEEEWKLWIKDILDIVKERSVSGK